MGVGAEPKEQAATAAGAPAEEDEAGADDRRGADRS